MADSGPSDSSDCSESGRDVHYRCNVIGFEEALEEVALPFDFLSPILAEGEFLEESPYLDSVHTVLNEQEELDFGEGAFTDQIARIIWTHRGNEGFDPWYCFCKMKNGVYALMTAECDGDGFEVDGEIDILLASSYKNMVLHGMTDKVYDLFYEETEEPEVVPGSECGSEKDDEAEADTWNDGHDEEQKEIEALRAKYANRGYVPCRECGDDCEGSDYESWRICSRSCLNDRTRDRRDY
jgi:hypothetical protein